MKEIFAWKAHFKGFPTANLAKKISAIVCAGGLTFAPSAFAIDPSSFESQLQLIRNQQIETQKTSFETSELDAINRELKYEPGRLIARGVAVLQPEGTDSKQFPYGLRDVSSLDQSFSDERASLFILAVGREDQKPSAAKRLKVKDLKFPFVFEVLSEDLMPPYTPETWNSLDQSKDSIALTGIMSPDGILASPNSQEIIGFAVSEPVNIAGSFQRSTARILLSGKVDTKLYTKEEIALLTTIDAELDRLEAEKALPSKKI